MSKTHFLRKKKVQRNWVKMLAAFLFTFNQLQSNVFSQWGETNKRLFCFCYSFNEFLFESKYRIRQFIIKRKKSCNRKHPQKVYRRSSTNLHTFYLARIKKSKMQKLSLASFSKKAAFFLPSLPFLQWTKSQVFFHSCRAHRKDGISLCNDLLPFFGFQAKSNPH